MYVTYQDTNFRAAAVAADEYRKTISKDAALERRFQPVTIDEPTVESTISILRGLKPRYEVCSHPFPLCAHVSHHPHRSITGLRFPTARWSPVCVASRQHREFLNQTLYVSAAVYSARYISDRFLPDKAIDLVDEASSSLRLAQESKPDGLEQLDRAVMTMQIELTSLRNESDPLSAERREGLEQALERTRTEAATLEERWQAGT